MSLGAASPARRQDHHAGAMVPGSLDNRSGIRKIAGAVGGAVRNLVAAPLSFAGGAAASGGLANGKELLMEALVAETNSDLLRLFGLIQEGIWHARHRASELCLGAILEARSLLRVICNEGKGIAELRLKPIEECLKAALIIDNEDGGVEEEIYYSLSPQCLKFLLDAKKNTTTLIKQEKGLFDAVTAFIEKAIAKATSKSDSNWDQLVEKVSSLLSPPPRENPHTLLSEAATQLMPLLPSEDNPTATPLEEEEQHTARRLLNRLHGLLEESAQGEGAELRWPSREEITPTLKILQRYQKEKGWIERVNEACKGAVAELKESGRIALADLKKSAKETVESFFFGEEEDADLAVNHLAQAVDALDRQALKQAGPVDHVAVIDQEVELLKNRVQDALAQEDPVAVIDREIELLKTGVQEAFGDHLAMLNPALEIFKNQVREATPETRVAAIGEQIELLKKNAQEAIRLAVITREIELLKKNAQNLLLGITVLGSVCNHPEGEPEKILALMKSEGVNFRDRVFSLIDAPFPVMGVDGRARQKHLSFAHRAFAKLLFSLLAPLLDWYISGVLNQGRAYVRQLIDEAKLDKFEGTVAWLAAFANESHLTGIVGAFRVIQQEGGATEGTVKAISRHLKEAQYLGRMPLDQFYKKVTQKIVEQFLPKAHFGSRFEEWLEDVRIPDVSRLAFLNPVLEIVKFVVFFPLSQGALLLQKGINGGTLLCAQQFLSRIKLGSKNQNLLPWAISSFTSEEKPYFHPINTILKQKLREVWLKMVREQNGPTQEAPVEALRKTTQDNLSQAVRQVFALLSFVGKTRDELWRESQGKQNPVHAVSFNIGEGLLEQVDKVIIEKVTAVLRSLATRDQIYDLLGEALQSCNASFAKKANPALLQEEEATFRDAARVLDQIITFIFRQTVGDVLDPSPLVKKNSHAFIATLKEDINGKGGLKAQLTPLLEAKNFSQAHHLGNEFIRKREALLAHELGNSNADRDAIVAFLEISNALYSSWLTPITEECRRLAVLSRQLAEDAPSQEREQDACQKQEVLLQEIKEKRSSLIDRLPHEEIPRFQALLNNMARTFLTLVPSDLSPKERLERYALLSDLEGAEAREGLNRDHLRLYVEAKAAYSQAISSLKRTEAASVGGNLEALEGQCNAVFQFRQDAVNTILLPQALEEIKGKVASRLEALSQWTEQQEVPKYTPKINLTRFKDPAFRTASWVLSPYTAKIPLLLNQRYFWEHLVHQILKSINDRPLQALRSE